MIQAHRMHIPNISLRGSKDEVRKKMKTKQSECTKSERAIDGQVR